MNVLNESLEYRKIKTQIAKDYLEQTKAALSILIATQAVKGLSK